MNTPLLTKTLPGKIAPLLNNSNDKKRSAQTPLNEAQLNRPLEQEDVPSLTERSTTDTTEQLTPQEQELVNKSDFWSNAGGVAQWPYAAIELFNCNKIKEAVSRMKELIEVGHKEALSRVLKEEVNRDDELFHMQCNSGLTALHWAAKMGMTEIIEIFIECGTHPDIGDNDERTALHYSIYYDHLKSTEALLRAGANPCICSKGGNTPLDFANNFGNKKIITFLRKYNEAEGILEALRTKEFEKAICLIQNAFHIQRVFGPQHIRGIFASKRIKALQEALRNEGDLLNEQDSTGKLLLYYAKEKRYSDVFTLLINAGVNLNPQDSDGWTVLHRAAAEGAVHIISMLLAQGADIEAKDNEGLTPLHKAALAGEGEAIQVLLKNGAERCTPDSYGKTPVEYAYHYGKVGAIAAFRNMATSKTG